MDTPSRNDNVKDEELDPEPKLDNKWNQEEEDDDDDNHINSKSHTDHSDAHYGLSDDAFETLIYQELCRYNPPLAKDYPELFRQGPKCIVQWRRRYRGDPSLWKRLFRKDKVLKEFIEAVPVLDAVQRFVVEYQQGQDAAKTAPPTTKLPQEDNGGNDNKESGDNNNHPSSFSPTNRNNNKHKKFTIVDLASGKGFLSMFLCEMLPPSQVERFVLVDKAWPMHGTTPQPHHISWEHIYGTVTVPENEEERNANKNVIIEPQDDDNNKNKLDKDYENDPTTTTNPTTTKHSPPPPTPQEQQQSSSTTKKENSLPCHHDSIQATTRRPQPSSSKSASQVTEQHPNTPKIYMDTFPIPIVTCKQDLKKSRQRRKLEELYFLPSTHDSSHVDDGKNNDDGPVILLAIHLCGILSLKAIDFFNYHSNRIQFFCVKPCCLPGMIHARRHERFVFQVPSPPDILSSSSSLSSRPFYSFDSKLVCVHGKWNKDRWCGPNRSYVASIFDVWCHHLFLGICATDLSKQHNDNPIIPTTTEKPEEKEEEKEVHSNYPCSQKRPNAQKAHVNVCVQHNGGYQNDFLFAGRLPVSSSVWDRLESQQNSKLEPTPKPPPPPKEPSLQSS